MKIFYFALVKFLSILFHKIIFDYYLLGLLEGFNYWPYIKYLEHWIKHFSNNIRFLCKRSI